METVNKAITDEVAEEKLGTVNGGRTCSKESTLEMCKEPCILQWAIESQKKKTQFASARGERRHRGNTIYLVRISEKNKVVLSPRPET